MLEAIIVQLLIVYSLNVLLVVTAFSELTPFFQCFLQIIVPRLLIVISFAKLFLLFFLVRLIFRHQCFRYCWISFRPEIGIVKKRISYRHHTKDGKIFAKGKKVYARLQYWINEVLSLLCRKTWMSFLTL